MRKLLQKRERKKANEKLEKVEKRRMYTFKENKCDKKKLLR